MRSQQKIDCPRCKEWEAFTIKFGEHKGTGIMVPCESGPAKCSNCGIFLSVVIASSISVEKVDQ